MTYQTNRTTLIDGNCLEVMMVESAKESVDLIVTDPPYLIDYQSNHRKEKFNRITNDTNLDFIENYLQLCHRILKNNSSIYVFCDYKTIDIFKPIFSRYFQLKNVLIWVKNNWGMGDLTGAYAHRYEMILYGSKGRNLLRSKRYDDILVFDRVNPNSMIHPTEKPVSLLEFLITNSSDIDGIVFDGCAGSASTAIAAINTDRRFIGVEIDTEHYNKAVNKIENHISQMRLF